MRVQIPANLKGKELFDYLVKNKEAIIEQKKSLPVFTDIFHCDILQQKKDVQVKALADGITLTPGSLVVDAIANSSNWFDSHADVMLPDNWNKSIKERGKKMLFLKDHDWRSVSAKIAQTLDVYTVDMSLKEMGIKSDIETTQVLVFKGEVIKEINEDIYNRFKHGWINQFSIGMQYVQMELAINDPDQKAEFKTWNKYYGQIINKSEVDKYGYFWAIKEAKIIECSAVLMASNTATGVISAEETKEKSLTESEPETSTQQKEQPNYFESFKKLKETYLKK